MGSMTDPDKVARISKILSANARVRIVQLLKDRVLCVGALAARLGITQGGASQHLRVLRDAELVIPERRGYYTHYRLNEETLAKWGEAVQRLFEMDTRQDSSTAYDNHEKKGSD